MAHETPNKREAQTHIRVGLALLVEDRTHEHSREDIQALLDAEVARAFGEGG